MAHKNGKYIRRTLLGYACILLGIIGGFIPIFQGWFFIALGLILLKDHPWAQKVLLWLEKKSPRFKKAYLGADTEINKWLIKFKLMEK
ncbi:MAG: hypothetical protein HOI80_03500 [Alphaproteobacteria bacterium]|jgi:uncharacterized protein|nr:hypothetical protein [Alphaproteobacteria bacterium]MBT5389601.1 hypothetical protein [Alphaproteobacteria bacterium]MBT5540165.1 hypothetical protein [Alphaproteobacteria bacterium]MBT5654550.1 hypothetical protein [Alphaproteobacteria bacterium]